MREQLKNCSTHLFLVKFNDVVTHFIVDAAKYALPILVRRWHNAGAGLRLIKIRIRDHDTVFLDISDTIREYLHTLQDTTLYPMLVEMVEPQIYTMPDGSEQFFSPIEDRVYSILRDIITGMSIHVYNRIITVNEPTQLVTFLPNTRIDEGDY